MSRLGRLWRLTPGRIAVGYVLFGVAWIVISDRVVLAVFETESARLTAQTVKGWIFVGLSALLIFGLSSAREGQIERAREQAAAASQQLQVLHRIFRHNVRNDMTVLQGFSRVIREESEDVPESWLAALDETATGIIESSKKLRIVGDVDGDPDGTVDLIAILEEEIDHFTVQYPGVELTASHPDRLLVQGEWALQYAVREALENAMEHHSDPAGDRHVTIEVGSSGGTATVAISDDGPGIPAAETVPIEAGEERPLSHGSGVGLWLIAWLCRRHGGSVTFHTGPGTTVELSLPLADPVERVADRFQSNVQEARPDSGAPGS